MPGDTTLALPRAERVEAPAARRGAPQGQPERPIERPSEPEKAPPSPRRRWLRWALSSLLPLALIAGAYWYTTGGQVMSTDDAYVEAEKVGISTDVSGIVKGVDVMRMLRKDHYYQ
jgi:membrane fusion protein (multidrug efflux system)